MFSHYYFNKNKRYVIHKCVNNRRTKPPHYYLAFAHIISLHNCDLPNDDSSTFMITNNDFQSRTQGKSYYSSYYNNPFGFDNRSRQSSIEYFSNM
jgi:hypothetical protein